MTLKYLQKQFYKVLQGYNLNFLNVFAGLCWPILKRFSLVKITKNILILHRLIKKTRKNIKNCGYDGNVNTVEVVVLVVYFCIETKHKRCTKPVT